MPVNPDNIPDNPPGYIWMTNVNYLESEQEIIEEISKEYAFPKEDILVLKNVVPGLRYSVFLPSKYEEWIKSWQDQIEEMMKLFYKITDPYYYGTN